MREPNIVTAMRIINTVLVHLLALRGVDTILATTKRQVEALRVRQEAQLKKSNALRAASLELGYRSENAANDAAKAARVATKLETLIS